MEERRLDSMCRDCEHLKTICDGSRSGFYSGCVLKNIDHDRAAAYIESMTKLFTREPDPTAAILTGTIEKQVAEATTPAADLSDREIIDNRFL